MFVVRDKILFKMFKLNISHIVVYSKPMGLTKKKKEFCFRIATTFINHDKKFRLNNHRIYYKRNMIG